MDKKKPRLPKPKTLIECFEGLPDPRLDRTRRHKLIDILSIGLCSMLTGGGSFTDMEDFAHVREEWFETFLSIYWEVRTTGRPGGLRKAPKRGRLVEA